MHRVCGSCPRDSRGTGACRDPPLVDRAHSYRSVSRRLPAAIWIADDRWPRATHARGGVVHRRASRPRHHGNGPRARHTVVGTLPALDGHHDEQYRRGRRDGPAHRQWLRTGRVTPPVSRDNIGRLDAHRRRQDAHTVGLHERSCRDSPQWPRAQRCVLVFARRTFRDQQFLSQVPPRLGAVLQ